MTDASSGKLKIYLHIMLLLFSGYILLSPLNYLNRAEKLITKKASDLNEILNIFGSHLTRLSIVPMKASAQCSLNVAKMMLE